MFKMYFDEENQSYFSLDKSYIIFKVVIMQKYSDLPDLYQNAQQYFGYVMYSNGSAIVHTYFYKDTLYNGSRQKNT